MAKGKYTEWIESDGLEQLRAWARDGLTDEQIAHNMGICRDTLYEWKKRFPDMADALKKGKDAVDLEVENALLKRAMGYEYTETRTETTEDGMTRTVVTQKAMPPDTTAQIFWLKNRRPAVWRDKQQVEHSTDKPFEVNIRVVE